MFLDLDTSTSHRTNELLITRSVEALEFPRKSSDTQPPPATALRDNPLWGESDGTTATALLSAMVQPATLTFHISKAATAPPHVEHGSLDRVPVGHPITPPTAEFRLKVLFSTWRNKPLPPPVADKAPPLAALQLMKQLRNTATLLPMAETAPPLPSALAQCWKVTPVIVTVELVMLKAEPVVCPSRRLQSKMEAEATPLTTSDAALLMLTVDSLNTPALRLTCEAPTCSIAYAMVRQINFAAHEESSPVRGSTRTEIPAAAAAVDHVDATKTHAIISSASESEGPSVHSRHFSRATRQHNFDRVQPSMNMN